MSKLTPLFSDQMNDHLFLKILHETAQDSSNVRFFAHALERMEQRQITPRQVVETLRRGFLAEPVAQDIYGDWVGKVLHTSAGDRINVVAKLKKHEGHFILVITTY